MIGASKKSRHRVYKFHFQLPFQRTYNLLFLTTAGRLQGSFASKASRGYLPTYALRTHNQPTPHTILDQLGPETQMPIWGGGGVRSTVFFHYEGLIFSMKSNVFRFFITLLQWFRLKY